MSTINKLNINKMKLHELLEFQEKVKELETVPLEIAHKEYIELLKTYQESVFTFHMNDGQRILKSDSKSNQEEMKLFFKNFPPEGCESIEFHK